MNGELSLFQEWIRVSGAIALTLVITLIIPVIWLAARKKISTRLIRIWCPIGVLLSTGVGVAISQGSLSDKLITIAVVAVPVGVGNYLGWILYSWFRHRLEH